MSFIDILIVGVALAIVAISVRTHIKARKARKAGAAPTCSGCSGCAYKDIGACNKEG